MIDEGYRYDLTASGGEWDCGAALCWSGTHGLGLTWSRSNGRLMAGSPEPWWPWCSPATGQSTDIHCHCQHGSSGSRWHLKISRVMYCHWPCAPTFVLVAAGCSPPERTHETASHGDHQTGCQHPEHAAQQQGPALHIVLHDHVSLGAAVLVIHGAAAEDVEVVIAVGAVEARVPLPNSVNVARTIFRAQNCWNRKRASEINGMNVCNVLSKTERNLYWELRERNARHYELTQEEIGEIILSRKSVLHSDIQMLSRQKLFAHVIFLHFSSQNFGWMIKEIETFYLKESNKADVWDRRWRLTVENNITSIVWIIISSPFRVHLSWSENESLCLGDLR